MNNVGCARVHGATPGCALVKYGHCLPSSSEIESNRSETEKSPSKTKEKIQAKMEKSTGTLVHMGWRTCVYSNKRRKTNKQMMSKQYSVARRDHGKKDQTVVTM